MPYEHMVDLLKMYAKLLFQLGEYNSYLKHGASVSESIVIIEQSKGITYLLEQVRKAILSYADDGIDSYLDQILD